MKRVGIGTAMIGAIGGANGAQPNLNPKPFTPKARSSLPDGLLGPVQLWEAE